MYDSIPILMSAHIYAYQKKQYIGEFNLLKAERTLIIKALQKTNWDVSEAMILNGIEHKKEDAYRKQIKRHSIDVVGRVIRQLPETKIII